MHPYTIDTGIRKKILWWIFIVSIILSSVAIYYFFDNVLWRTKWFKKILNVPDLRGHWVGTLTSDTYQKTINMELDVKQTWSKISFVSTFPKSKSESNVASMFIKRDGIIKVGFGFINHSRELPHQYDILTIVIIIM